MWLTETDGHTTKRLSSWDSCGPRHDQVENYNRSASSCIYMLWFKQLDAGLIYVLIHPPYKVQDLVERSLGFLYAYIASMISTLTLARWRARTRRRVTRAYSAGELSNVALYIHRGGLQPRSEVYRRDDCTGEWACNGDSRFATTFLSAYLPPDDSGGLSFPARDSDTISPESLTFRFNHPRLHYYMPTWFHRKFMVITDLHAWICYISLN